MSLSLRMDLSLTGLIVGRGGSSAPTFVTGNAMSMAVSDATILDPDGAGKGVFANGWTATIVFKGLSVNANRNLFNGQVVTIACTDPGFDTSGNATTVNRTIKGSISLRRPYPNPTQRHIALTGSDLAITFALDDVIYQGTTINSVTVGSGAYAGVVANTITTGIVNSSTRQYPQPYMAWVNKQYGRAPSGSTFLNVELDTAHRHARNGQMVACVKFTGIDPAGHTSAVQTISAPALSTLQTRGNVGEVWPAAVPLAALDQTTVATGHSRIRAQAYPWIGDASAVMDSDATGLAKGDPRSYQSLYFVNDKSGTYGGAYAYVKAGASGGTVSSDPVAARAAPFPTCLAAANAVTAWNNTNRGHNDASGSIIRLMDDGAGGTVAHAWGANRTVTAAGLCWVRYEADPLNTGVVQIAAPSSTQRTTADLVEIGAGIVALGASNSAIGTLFSNVSGATTFRFSFDGCDFDISAAATTTQTICDASYIWMRNVRFLGDGSKTTNTHNGNTARLVSCIGVVGTKLGIAGAYYYMGNQWTQGRIAGEPAVVTPIADGLIFHNNSNKHVIAESGSGCGFCGRSNVAYDRGAAIFQNEWEMLSQFTGSPQTILFTLQADGGVASVGESLDMCNTVLGNRGNWIYADNSGSQGLEARGVSINSLWTSKPIKCDNYQNSLSVRNWEWAHQVGCRGTFCIAGAAQEFGTTLQTGVDPECGAATPNDKWQGMWWQPGSVNQYFASNATDADVQAALQFVDDKCGKLGSGVGNGNYRPSGTSVLKSRVPAGTGVLKYDLGGALRKTDGTGAVGAYEYV